MTFRWLPLALACACVAAHPDGRVMAEVAAAAAKTGGVSTPTKTPQKAAAPAAKSKAASDMPGGFYPGGYGYGGDDANKGGAAVNYMGNEVKYMAGSKLSIAWTSQHSCGSENAECQVVIQYM